MSGAFRVVTDVKKIAALNRELGSRLSATFQHQETREITYPSGHFTSSVFFERSTGTGVRAWCPHKHHGKFLNFLLLGDPNSTAWMEIAVQLNFPGDKYNRLLAGAFVIDQDENVFLAHRGKLTKGKAGLHKEKVFREFASRVITADDGNLASQLILIGPLRDKSLPARLWDFAEEARAVATKIGNESHASAKASKPGPGASAGAGGNGKTQERLTKLRAYFDEYAGDGKYKGHGGGTRVVEHGDIVRALERVMRRRGETQKSQAIDLAVVTDSKVDLFEVKTSSRTTDIYTGVGQLLIHGGTLSDTLKTKVERMLVLPEAPNATQVRQIQRSGLRIVTFNRTGRGYSFSGL